MLVQVHAGMVYATAQRVTRDAALAEDVAQETFLELGRSAGEVSECVGAWLHRVAWRRACIAARAAATRRRYEAAAAADAHALSAPEATWEEIEPLVDEALAALPERLRGPLVEHFLGGRTQLEIARQLGVSQPTVSRLLDSGVEALRGELQRHGVLVGGTLALTLTAHAAIAPPAAVTAVLGKLALSGVGAHVAAPAAAGPLPFASAARHWRTVMTVAGLGAGAVLLFLAIARERKGETPPKGAPLPAPVEWAPPIQEWSGRAFCPECALPHTAGRRPEQGIFIRTEGGRDVVRDLFMPEPPADFHVRFCGPSMGATDAVRLRGSEETRDGAVRLRAEKLEITPE